MDLESINNTLDKRLSRNKWEFLYEYAIKALDQDIYRFHKLDEKITKFMNTTTVIFGAFVAAIPFVFKTYFPPKTFFEWLLIIVLAITFICLCSLWEKLFRALKLASVPRMPFDDNVIKIFRDDKNVNNIFWRLTDSCKKAYLENLRANEEKVKLLTIAYDDAMYAASFIVADLMLLVVLALI